MNMLMSLRSGLLAMALIFPIYSAKSTDKLSEYTTYTLKDLYCLTKNIYHEARGESQLGKIAVAQVTMNRVNHETKFPGTVCEVVYQQVRGVPQFSWTTMSTKITDSRAWYEAREVAYGVLSGNLSINNFSFTHFHNKTVEHGQNKKYYKIIGNHVFYQ